MINNKNFVLLLVLALIFQNTATIALPKNKTDSWQKKVKVEVPPNWTSSEFWQGAIPVVRWDAPGKKAAILIQKFGPNSPWPTPEKFLDSDLAAAAKGSKAVFLKKINLHGDLKAKLYERTYEEVELGFRATDIPPQVKSRQTLKEQFVIVPAKDSFYIIRFQAPRWRFWWMKSHWDTFLNAFLLL